MRISATHSIQSWVKSAEIDVEDIKIYSFEELKDQYIEWVHQNEQYPPMSLPTFSRAMAKYCHENNITRQTKNLLRNKTRREIFELDKYKKFSSTIEEKFEHIAHIVRLVSNGFHPFGIIIGPTRIGKTYHVLKTLEETDKKFFNFTGVVDSAFHLYKLLYENRNNIIVFDDSKSLLKDKKCIDILLPVFDNYETKEITYRGNAVHRRAFKDVPTSFVYKGGALFLANLFRKEIYDPLWERALPYEIDVDNKEMTKYIARELKNIHTNIPIRIRKEAFNFLVEIQEVYECINFGMLNHAILYRKAAEDSKLLKKNRDWWKKSILQMLTYSDRKK